jgi:hypothetical protein
MMETWDIEAGYREHQRECAKERMREIRENARGGKA